MFTSHTTKQTIHQVQRGMAKSASLRLLKVGLMLTNHSPDIQVDVAEITESTLLD